METATKQPTAVFATIAEAAIKHGFSIIPLKPRSKDPMPGWGALKKARVVPNVPEDCNVGIVADEHFLIFETDNLERCTELLKNEGVKIPRTFTVESRPGRRHYYFRQTEKTMTARNSTLMGIFEFRAHNQYVVGPGSIHPKTGLPYQIVDDCEVVPFPNELLRAIQHLKGEANQYAERARAIISAGGKIGEGDGRHYAILEFCAKAQSNVDMWEGEALQKLYEDAMQYNIEHCDPPHSPEHVAEIVNWFEDKEPNRPGIKVKFPTPKMKGAAVPLKERGKTDYPLKAATTRFSGWFAKGSVHVIGGSSGSGKTTIMTQALTAQAARETFLGHEGAGMSYLFIFADRGRRDNAETMERLGLNADDIPMTHIPIALDGEAITTILDRIEQHDVPEVVFIEGADGLISDPNKTQVVAPFLRALGSIAEHYHISIVLSVGAGKAKPKDQYLNKRDRIFGSQAWSRWTSDVVLMAKEEEGASEDRHCDFFHRNAKDEEFNLRFNEHGRLEVRQVEPEPEAEPRDQTGRKLNGKFSQFITFLESQPVGTVIDPDKLPYFGSPAAIKRTLAELAHPVSGWVTKVEDGGRRGKWTVTNQALYGTGNGSNGHAKAETE
jgi:hypothetical protein